MNIFNQSEVSPRLCKAFLENITAVQKFKNLAEEEQKELVERARNASTDEDIKKLISNLP